METHAKLSGLETKSLSNEWISWVTECRLFGIDDRKIIETLIQHNFDEKIINDLLQALDSNPIYNAAHIIGQRFQKLASIMNAQNELEKLSTQLPTVDYRNLNSHSFKEQYYAKNRPVLIANFAKDWSAYEKWTSEFFKEVYGAEIVEVMAGRESDPNYELNLTTHRTDFTMSDYVDLINSSQYSNDSYLVANNHFFETPKGEQLLKDILPLPDFLNENLNPAEVFFWFGPAGTVTPLHHDEMNVLLTQIKGRKKITLISPCQSPLLYNDIGVYSMVDPESPDLEKFPLFNRVTKIEVTLEPGEALFIPVGWWHHVRSLDLSISVSFINFVYPNTFEWDNPNINLDY